MGSAFQRRSGARTRVCGPSNVSASFSVARLHIAPTRSGTKRQDSEDGDSKWREASVFAVWWQHALDHILKIWQLYVLSVFALGWSPDRSPIAGREKTRNRMVQCLARTSRKDILPLLSGCDVESLALHRRFFAEASYVPGLFTSPTLGRSHRECFAVPGVRRTPHVGFDPE